MNDLKAGVFSIVNFYNRRIRRIFPALFLVYGVVLLYNLALPFSSEARFINQGLLSSMVFVSNIFFHSHGGYFGKNLEEHPLLHTWSLSVEEQFYVFFPLLILFLFRFGNKALPLIFSVLGIASFAACVWQLNHDKEAAFYLVQFRAWELLIGAILATNIPAISSRKLAEGMSITGLTMILVGVGTITPKTDFPGYAALLPCIGTALIIYASHQHETFVSRLLSIKQLQFIGLVSYSFYLWHWPVWVIYQQYFTETPILIRVLLILLSFGLAVLSWKYVETPFRKGQFNISPRRTVLLGCLIVLIALPASFSLHTVSRYLWKEPKEVQAFLKYENYKSRFMMRGGKCFLFSRKGDIKFYDKKHCLKLDKKKKNYLILGDSHAAHFWYGLQNTYPQINFLQATSSGCLIFYQDEGRPYCRKLMNYIWKEFLPKHKLDGIILSGRWEKEHLARLKQHEKLLKQFADRVIVFGPIAEYEGLLPRLIAKSLITGNDDPINNARKIERKKMDRFMSDKLKAASFEYISIYNAICPEKCLVTIDNSIPVQHDYGHLTGKGSIELSKRIKEQLFPDL